MAPQITEVFYSNPHCETQYEDLSRNGEHSSNGNRKCDIFLIADRALIGARENEHLWYSSMSQHYTDHSVEDIDSQKDDDEKYQDLSGLMHGIQPSDHHGIQHWKYDNTRSIQYNVQNPA